MAAERRPRALTNADELRRRFRHWLAGRDLRATSRRMMVVDHLARRGGHCTLQQLIDELLEIDPTLGSVTVYRTVRLLEDAGLVERTTLAGADHYELAGGHHDHIVCDVCGKVAEFHVEAIEQRQRVVAAAHGFRMTDHEHVIRGVCADCRAVKA